MNNKREIRIIAKLEALRLATGMLKNAWFDYEFDVYDPELLLKETLLELSNKEIAKLAESMRVRAENYAKKHGIDPDFNEFNPEKLF